MAGGTINLMDDGLLRRVGKSGRLEHELELVLKGLLGDYFLFFLGFFLAKSKVPLVHFFPGKPCFFPRKSVVKGKDEVLEKKNVVRF